MNKVNKSYNYADYIIDFAMLGKSTSTGLVAIQFISNKPVPVLKENIPQGEYNQISLDVGAELSHECTFTLELTSCVSCMKRLVGR